MPGAFSALVEDLRRFLDEARNKGDSGLRARLARFYSDVVNQVHEVFDDVVKVLDDIKNDPRDKLSPQEIATYKSRLSDTSSPEKFKGPRNICAKLAALARDFDESIAPLLAQHNLDISRYRELHLMLDKHESLFLNAVHSIESEIAAALDEHQKGESFDVAKSVAREAGVRLNADMTTLSEMAASLSVGLRGLGATLLDSEMLLTIIRQAIAAVPAVKFALGVAGIAAAGAIVVGVLGYGKATAIIVGAMFVAMILLFIFSRLARADNPSVHLAGQVLVWAVTVFFCAFLVMTVTAFAGLGPGPFAEFLGVSVANGPASPRIELQQSALGDHCPNVLFDGAERDFGVKFEFDPPALRHIAICGPGNYPQNLTVAEGVRHYLVEMQKNCLATTIDQDGTYIIRPNLEGESRLGTPGQTVSVQRPGSDRSFFVCKCDEAVRPRIVSRALVCGA